MNAATQFHEYKVVALASVKPYERNPRTHSDEQIAQLRRSIREFGFTNPLLLDESNGIIAGYGRYLAAKAEGMTEAPAIVVAGLTEDAKRALVIADNKLALNAGWDETTLVAELNSLSDGDFDLALTGFSPQEIEALLNPPPNPLARYNGKLGALQDKFLVPPFSVLDARQGYWQDRKRMWLSIGIRSEEGRPGNLLNFSDAMRAAQAGKKGRREDWSTPYAGGDAWESTGTSVFDPVLCELAYRWWSPPGGAVLDPFAGGSVRGIVAAVLERSYVGSDLSERQVAANQKQAIDILRHGEPAPVWHCSDSRYIEKTAAGLQADFLFSCPPYADLERYSDDPRDISTLDYSAFKAAYREIIAASCRLLKDDRFACFVVGEVRGKNGAYYNFVGDTIRAFTDAGLSYQNEAILVTAVGSLPLRAGRTFTSRRRVGKTHQNVLVFLKGDIQRAVAACGEIEIPAELFANDSAPATE